VLAEDPGGAQVGKLGLGGLPVADDLEVVVVDDVAVLDEVAAADGANLGARAARLPKRGGEDTKVLRLLLEVLERVRVVARGASVMSTTRLVATMPP
jgi:hypothetical protein